MGVGGRGQQSGPQQRTIQTMITSLSVWTVEELLPPSGWIMQDQTETLQNINISQQNISVSDQQCGTHQQ